MATRTSKKTTTTTVTQQQASAASPTPGSPAPSMRSPRRAPSPTLVTRRQEKESLAHLNDRLAAYIDKVRHLESENSRLTVQVRTQEETVTREITSIKSLYESELQDARKLLDETARDKAKLQIEVGKYQSEATDLRGKYGKKCQDYENIEKQLLIAETRVSDLNARYLDEQKQRKHWEEEYNKLKGDIAALEKKLASTQKQLEEETLRRVDLENRLQSLKEEIAFKGQVHEQELNETRTRLETTIEETDGRVQEDYEHRLREALQELRSQYEEQSRASREETEYMFTSKLTEIRELSERNANLATISRDELKQAKKKADELAAQVNRLGAQNSLYESRIKELELQLSRQDEAHQAEIDNLQRQLREMRERMEDQLLEYQDLMDIKIALDMEIAAYRKLLESEESRLNLSTTSVEGTPGRTPMRSTPVRGGTKRKRVSYSQGVGSSMLGSSSSSGHAQTSSAKGAVEVQETDTDGKYIKLLNNSSKDQSIGGWQLKHTAGNQETTYKFHRTVTLKPQTATTVYSSDTDKTHAPPSELVMKGQRWFTGDEMMTVLYNNDGDEMASRKLSKSLMRTTYQYSSTGSSGDSGLEGDPQNREKCVIM